MSIDNSLAGLQSLTTTIQSGTNAVTRTASDLGLGVASNAKYWKDNLRPATFRGVPFGVLGGSVQFGRRNAIHQYPYRDTVWVEDMGKMARRITMTGFLVENAAYGGGSVIAQRDRMMAACEAQGDGELFHPTLGRLTVSSVSCSAEERWDQGRVFELSFSFIESGKRIFPNVATSTADKVQSQAAVAQQAVTKDFISSTYDALKQGAATVLQAANTAAAWARKAQRLTNDATNMHNMVGNLHGQFGRFFGGGSVGGLRTSTKEAATSSDTVSTLIAKGSAARAGVATAGQQLSNSAASLSASTASNFGASAHALAAALYASTVDPKDAIRLLSNLADFTPNDPTTSAPIGVAMATVQSATGDLFRRAAAIALANASAAYKPSSAEDAANVQAAVCSVLDSEIAIAGDNGQDDTFNALRATRSAVVQDLSSRGAQLPSITTVSTPFPLPAPVLAQRLYRDPSRADELIIEANPIHPAFMPTSFKALAN